MERHGQPRNPDHHGDGTDRDFLTEYHSVINAAIEATRLNQTNARAMQNIKAMYSCLKSLITGSIKTFNLHPICKLLNFFILATTATREILEGKQLQHTFHVYEKIVQPEKW